MYYLIAAVVLGISLDIWTCILTVRRDKGGNGPSGLPIASVIVYTVPLTIWETAILTDYWEVDILIFWAIHCLIVFGIPHVLSAWRRRRLS